MSEFWMYGLAILSPLLGAIGHVLLKKFSLRQAKEGDRWGRFVSFGMGAGIFTVSSLIGITAMTMLDFSAFYSFTGLNYVFVSLLAHRWLNETIDRWKVLGNLAIVCGIVIYNLDAILG